ncbi:hypothetical protein GCM10010398_74240 [Streptomyces fimbriatus]
MSGAKEAVGRTPGIADGGHRRMTRIRFGHKGVHGLRKVPGTGTERPEDGTGVRLGAFPPNTGPRLGKLTKDGLREHPGTDAVPTSNPYRPLSFSSA